MSDFENKKSKKSYAGARLILLQDSVLSVLASLLSILLVRSLSEPIPGFSTIVWRYLGLSLAGAILGSLLSGLWKVEAHRMNSSAIGKILLLVFVKEVVLVVALLTGLVVLPAEIYAFLVIAVDVVFTAILLISPRYIFATMRREERAVSRNIGRLTALVAGTSPASAALAADAEASGRFNVVGFLTTDRSKEGQVISGLVVYFCEDVRDISALQWRLGGIDTVLFPMDWDHDEVQGTTVRSAADMSDHSRMTRIGYAFKRAFDIALSASLLIVFSPLIAICALAIYLEDGKPVIYRQERIGKFGKPFNILKFRSMRLDAEQGGPALYSGDSDDRLTKVGRFLRQHHLDELPQLWNVLRGDMSFIGYRPERQFYIDQIMERNPRYRYLYQIRPGVTSYATLYNGYTDTLEKMLTRLDLDLYYLRNHSVLFDAKVLGLTFLKIVSGRKF